MYTPEKKVVERINLYHESAQLLPIVTRYLTAFEDGAVEDPTWGDSPREVADILGSMGHNPIQNYQVRTLLLAGKGDIRINESLVSELNMGLKNVQFSSEGWRVYWSALALRATVMKLSGSEHERFENNLIRAELLQEEPDVFVEICGQLDSDMETDKVERMYKFLSGLNLRLLKQ